MATVCERPSDQERRPIRLFRRGHVILTGFCENPLGLSAATGRKSLPIS